MRPALVWVLAAAAALLLATTGTLAIAVVSDGSVGSAAYPGCSLPPAHGTLVTFTARDMGGMGGMGGRAGPMLLMPRVASAPAGTVTIELVNAGTRPHELLVLPLAAGLRPGARAVGSGDRVDEAGSVAEAVTVCPPDAGTDGTPPGGVARVTTRLAPGRYEVVCNLPGHYRLGMVALLTVG